MFLSNSHIVARSFSLLPSPLARHEASRDVCTSAFPISLGTRMPQHPGVPLAWPGALAGAVAVFAGVSLIEKVSRKVQARAKGPSS